MGRVTAEAMVAGRIIIGLDNAGTSELIEDVKTVFLYDGSQESLVHKMNFVKENDLSTISSNALELGFNKFLIEDYAIKINEIIKSVV